MADGYVFSMFFETFQDLSSGYNLSPTIGAPQQQGVLDSGKVDYPKFPATSLVSLLSTSAGVTVERPHCLQSPISESEEWTGTKQHGCPGEFWPLSSPEDDFHAIFSDSAIFDSPKSLNPLTPDDVLPRTIAPSQLTSPSPRKLDDVDSASGDDLSDLVGLMEPHPNDSFSSSDLSTHQMSNDQYEFQHDANNCESYDGVERKGRIWGMRAEEYRALPAKDRKRVRNRVSARRFRLKQKEYVTMVTADLRKKDLALRTATEDARRLRREVADLMTRLSNYEE